ncbi:MAG: OmpH family outer membrane protein [Synergistaceae bacterium]|jgi:outer membrane protein|nr:OmpH family outer membrane protein [Synergistaceae bacterium]
MTYFISNPPLSLKKWIWLSMAVVAFVAFAETAAGAVDVVGVVDSQKILFKHPRFDETARLLLFLSRPLEGSPARIIAGITDPKTKSLLSKSEDLLKVFSDFDRRLSDEKDPAKKNEIVQARQLRLNQEEGRLMTPILRECRQALEAVMRLKKMTVILELGSVYLGGADITNDVIRRLETL